MARWVDLDNPKIIKEGRDKFGNVLYAIPPDTKTSDVRPVRRGRWEWKHRHRGGFRRVIGEDDFGVRHTITVDQRYEIDDPYCPFCKKLNESVFLNFCPNCGADMRGGDADG